MAQRGRPTTLAERIEIHERSKNGQNDPQIALAMGLSAWTVRKWRRRAQHKGRTGLASRLGRPPSGTLGHCPDEMRETIRSMRKAHPGWGPVTIHTELGRAPHWTGQRLPSPSRIAVFLKEQELTRPYEHHTELSQPQAGAPHQAHEEWGMDAKGVMQVPSLGQVSLIHIEDIFSRLKVVSYPCLHTTKPNALDYQCSLRRGFLRYGLPQRVKVDHDSAFYDNTAASPFPTRLHLWVIALAVEVCFGRKGRPTDYSFIERTHQVMTQQAILGQEFAADLALQQALDERLDFLNTLFPCSALGDQPPLVAQPEASQSGRPYRPEWEEDLLDMSRVYAYLAQGRWFRRVSTQGQFSLGHYRYGVGKRFAHQTLEITFDPETVEFVCRSEDGHETARLPAQGLTKADLMGELSPLAGLPAYQLALPFSHAAWREMMLCHALTGTTL